MQAEKKPLLLFSDALSSRVFFNSGIVEGIYRRLNGELQMLSTFPIDTAINYRQWLSGDCCVRMLFHNELLKETDKKGFDGIRERLDTWLEPYIGFFPLAVRFSQLHNFSLERMARGHRNPFLDESRARPFPKSKNLFRLLYKWNFGKLKFVHPSIEKFIRDQCSTLILSNLQFPKVQGYINAAHRCGVPVIGHIASWDHPVGKGVVSPYCDRYIVQNSFMANALCKYHGISNKRIQVTGWPQMDMLATKKPGRAYKDLLRTYGIPDDKPCVLIAGNSENNSPYEPNFVSRVVKQREQSAAGDKFSIVFRPHPRDSVGDSWKKRYTSILDKSDLYVQKPSYDDTDTLATLLQHVDCVVTNAGTILLDALVCNRPVVCVLYDEGGPKGSRFAYKNVIGHHYHDLMESGAFYIAYSFDEYLGQMKRALRNPDELEKQRREIVARIVGKVDGQAGSRVVEAVVGQIRKDQHPME